MTQTQPETRYFVNRLLGPRPTFPMDISPEEKELMGAHAQYWMKHMAAGRVVVFGPVLDPKGVWGMGVVRARDEVEMQAMLDGDPVIVAQRGFSYEMLPMMRTVLPSDVPS